MSWGVIDWTAFTWEAFATLATGLAAVIAAFVVGLRQAAISQRQALILDRQVALAETALRGELYDRRIAIYDAVAESIERFLDDIREGRPLDSDGSNLGPVAMRSRLLFHHEVPERIADIHCHMQVMAERQEVLSRHDHTVDEERKVQAERIGWLLDRYEALPDLFWELRLGGAPRSPERR